MLVANIEVVEKPASLISFKYNSLPSSVPKTRAKTIIEADETRRLVITENIQRSEELISN